MGQRQEQAPHLACFDACPLCSPVFRAAFMGKKEAVELLLSYGADPTIRSKENENACDAASDPAIKQCVEAFSMESMQAALQAIELEVAGAWQKPPEPPDPAELVPKTGHCIRIALRGLVMLPFRSLLE